LCKNLFIRAYFIRKKKNINQLKQIQIKQIQINKTCKQASILIVELLSVFKLACNIDFVSFPFFTVYSHHRSPGPIKKYRYKLALSFVCDEIKKRTNYLTKSTCEKKKNITTSSIPPHKNQ